MKKYTFLFLIYSAFSISINAQSPQLWGTMQVGGPFGIGTITRINGDGSGFERIYSFSDGSPWCTLVPDGGSLLYGMTVSGGSHSVGNIFSYNSSNGAYNSLFSLDSANGYYPHGTVLMANDNKLYGMTSNGGAYNLGVLFSFDPSNSNFVKLHDFDNTTGQYPNGSVMQALNGKLYGMTSTGGTNGGGIIFSYDITNNVFSDVHDFDFATGFTPFGNLIEASNGLLYGMAFGGGTTGYGTIFSFDPANNSYLVIHNFNGTDGSAPFASLIQGDSELLYGCTSQGGANNDGTIFSIDVAGTTFTKLHDFDDATGSKPWGSVMQASDGNLYGLTAFGGANNVGAIYSYNLTSNIYTNLHDCDFTDGGFPYADLIEYNGTTGISSVNNETMKVFVYPNPSDGNITIEITKRNFQNALVTISDMIGKQLETKTLSQATTHFSLKYPRGEYLVSLKTEEGNVTTRITIE